MSDANRLPIIIIGSGAAGMSAALSLAPHPVILMTQTPSLWSGSTPWAQGGLAAAMADGDSSLAHARDTLTAGAGLSDKDAVQLLTLAAPDVLDHLIDNGFPADREANGSVSLGREGGHSAHRIVHSGGDRSGRALAMTLLDQVEKCPSISVMTDSFAWQVVQDKAGRVTGLLIRHAVRGWMQLPAAAVIVATGGIGQLFEVTTNPAESTGDGLALAARAGAALRDVEFMQFHPTGLKLPEGLSQTQSPLISEALRGAGALLVDQAGNRFMQHRHKLAELAPRDVVTRGIVEVQQKGGTAYLDLRPVAKTHGEAAFPQAFEGARDAGYDPLSTPVPIGPTAHFHMGGIRTDLRGRTTVEGLYAIGEVAATGLHGANRLASNSLTEALVMGRQVASALRKDGATDRTGTARTQTVPCPVQSGNGPVVTATLKSIASRALGPVRTGKGLQQALAEFARLSEQSHQSADDAAGLEARNLTLVARLLTVAALLRTESRGGHGRSDYPETDPSQAHSRDLIWPADLHQMSASTKPLISA
ncbi:MAG: L-aspartate oxidase [Alphaproteobacteria bacterium]